MYDFLDILCILSGVYVTYAAVLMKARGKIIKNVILNKGKDESSIRDKEGLIHFLYKKLFFLGLLIIFTGTMDLANSYLLHSGLVTAAACILFAAEVIIYGTVVSAALQKYAD